MHERDRARQRMVIASFFGLLTAGHAAYVGSQDLVHRLVPILSFAYAAYALFHLRVVLSRDWAGAGAQYVFIVLDSLITVVFLVGAPAVMSPLYPVLMVQIVRSGIRYGMRTMWLSWLAGAAAALALMPLSEFWRTEVQMLRSFAVMMLIIPLLMGPLIRRLHQVTSELRASADADPLTGLANRRCLAERIRQAQERSARDGTLLALIMLDLDNFKRVNDSMGHAQGDLILERVAAIAQAGCRGNDLVARVGGDEFVVLVEGLPLRKGRQLAQALAHRLVGAIQADAEQLAPGTGVSASAGLTYWADGHDALIGAAELLAQADQAMYRAKRASKARLATTEARGSAVID